MKSKAAALLLEKQRQLKEMDEKYSIRTDISLENGILYFVPLIRYTIDVVTGGKKVEKVIYYNAIIREFCCKV